MYKVFTLLGLLVLCTLAASAQYGCKTIIKGDTIYQRCYYTSGQLSTEVSYQKSDERWKHLKVYTTAKAVSYETSYGQRYGSSHVDLRYQAGGGVATAHYTMQPDGGIQYTDVTTYFRPDGTVDHEEDMSRGNDGELHTWLKHMPEKPQTVVQAPKPTPAPPAPAACQPVPDQKELYVVNYTSEALHLVCQYLDIQAASMGLDIEPADTAKVGIYSSFASSVDPLQHYTVLVANKARTGYQYQVQRMTSGTDAPQYLMIVCKRVKARK